MVPQKSLPSLTKIVGTVGNASQGVDVLGGLLEAGMTGEWILLEESTVSFHSFSFPHLMGGWKNARRLQLLQYSNP